MQNLHIYGLQRVTLEINMSKQIVMVEEDQDKLN